MSRRMLFKVHTPKTWCYVVASSFDEAANVVVKWLTDNNYGYYKDHCVDRIELIGTEKYEDDTFSTGINPDNETERAMFIVKNENI